MPKTLHPIMAEAEQRATANAAVHAATAGYDDPRGSVRFRDTFALFLEREVLGGQERQVVACTSRSCSRTLMGGTAAPILLPVAMESGSNPSVLPQPDFFFLWAGSTSINLC